jgi:glycosyltransferase involved in cell wall biosynthesis
MTRSRADRDRKKPSVNIGIDFTSAVQQGAGIGRLTRNIVRALAQLDHSNQYKLLIQGRHIEHPPPTRDPRNIASGIPNENFAEVRTRIDQKWWTRIWHRLRLPIPVEWVTGPLDLFHSPDFTLPPTGPHTRTLVTIHDLSFLRLPECFEPTLLAYLVGSVPRAVQQADWLLADSENTRRDLIELLDIPSDKITVIYPGVKARFCPIHDRVTLEKTRIKYGLPERFVLSLGTLQPRKNYARLIGAFAELDTPDVALVIVGGRGWMYENLFALVNKLELQDRVVFAGFVDDEDLPALYNLAEIFCFPSQYEGFGIPPLEAMACGVPVIAADNSSLPEVIGDAGIMIDASDQAALADALNHLLRDQTRQQELAARGLSRARRFQWQDAAALLLDTYRRLDQL